MPSHNKGKIDNKKIIFCSGKLNSIFGCFFAVMLYPYLNDLGLELYISLPIVFVSAVLPIIILPVLYEIINSLQSLSTGKYHIALAVSTVGLAFFNVLLFSMNSSWQKVLMAITLFISMFFTVLFIMLYLYVYASIASRILGTDEDRLKKVRYGFSVLGVIMFLVIYITVSKSNGFAYFNMACLVSSIVAITGFLSYLSTAPYMPRFLCMDAPTKRTLKQKYKKFFSPFFTYENNRFFICFSLFCVSSILLLLNAVKLFELFNISKTIAVLGILLIAIIAAVIIGLLNNRIIRSKNSALTVSVLLMCGVCGLLIFRIYFEPHKILNILYYFICSAMLGGSAGLFACVSIKMISFIKSRSDSSKGKMILVRNLLVLGSFIVALIFTEAFSVLNVSLLINISIAAAMAFAVIAVYFIKKRYLTLEFPGENHD